MPLPRSLARFNINATNRLTGLVAGRLPGYAIILHKGRNSGRAYRTPVNAFEVDGGYRIALTYGKNSDWVKNVLAAGGFEVEHRGTTIALTAPTVVHDPAMAWAPIGFRQVLKTLGVQDYLQATPAA